MRGGLHHWSVLLAGLAGALSFATGCGGPGPRDLVGLDQVPGGSAPPQIERITDLGDLGPLPARGPLPAADTDGQFAIGELVLIEGESFGKLPALRIGGAPVEIEARTASGGVIGRVPPGIDAGPLEVVLSHQGGRDSATISVERHAVVVDRAAGEVHVVALGRPGTARLRASFPLPGALDAAVSWDGQVAYVVTNPTGAGGSASLHVIALTAAGKPRLLRQHHLPMPRASALGAAVAAPVAAVAGSGKLVVLDIREPRAPAIGAPFPLVGDARALAVQPQGRRVVVLSPHDNELTPIDLTRPEQPRVDQPVDLLPGEREPLAIDVEFAPGGNEAWALCGDQPTTLAGGSHPTRLVVVDWETGVARVHRTVELASAGAPIALGVGAREAVGSAAAIRSTRHRAPIVVAAVSPALWASEQKVAPSSLADLGRLVSADLDGRAEVLVTQTAVYGEPEVTHDLAWAISPTVRLRRDSGGTSFELGLTFQPLGAAGDYRFVRLGDGSPERLAEPPAFALSP